MESKELRLGNLVLHNGKICEVIGISNDDWIQITNDQLNTRIEEIQPLSLDQINYKKTKFKDQRDAFIFGGIKIYQSSFLVTYYNSTFPHIVYFHRLQNFFYSLYDYELEYKLPLLLKAEAGKI